MKIAATQTFCSRSIKVITPAHRSILFSDVSEDYLAQPAESHRTFMSFRFQTPLGEY
jgi:hypothetical protein